VDNYSFLLSSETMDIEAEVMEIKQMLIDISRRIDDMLDESMTEELMELTEKSIMELYEDEPDLYRFDCCKAAACAGHLDVFIGSEDPEFYKTDQSQNCSQRPGRRRVRKDRWRYERRDQPNSHRGGPGSGGRAMALHRRYARFLQRVMQSDFYTIKKLIP